VKYKLAIGRKLLNCELQSRKYLFVMISVIFSLMFVFMVMIAFDLSCSRADLRLDKHEMNNRLIFYTTTSQDGRSSFQHTQ